jgi:prophage regulatory protein
MGQTTRFIRMTELKDKVALSRSQIYKLIQQGEFPEPIKLGKKISVWTDSEVEEWMSKQVPIKH